jgi:hypothetical protein
MTIPAIPIIRCQRMTPTDKEKLRCEETPEGCLVLPKRYEKLYQDEVGTHNEVHGNSRLCS